MTTDEMIAVLQAYKEGKKIESKSKTGEGKWIPFSDSSDIWDFVWYDYRVKPKPYYRPFKNADEVLEAIKEHGDWVKYDTYFDKIVGLAHNSVSTIEANIDYGTAFRKFQFLDGTLFGKIVK